MNKLKKVILIAIVLVNLPLNNIASAGLFDWINVSNNDFNSFAQNESWTFDSLYSSIKNSEKNEAQEMQTIQSNSIMTASSPTAPKSLNKPVNKIYTVTATAYSSTPDQTDDSPFITASGTHVRDGIVATNFLPFGTIIKIPDLYGDKIFVVEDRMNRRYWDRVDIWFSERETALRFGKKTITIEVVAFAQN